MNRHRRPSGMLASSVLLAGVLVLASGTVAHAEQTSTDPLDAVSRATPDGVAAAATLPFDDDGSHVIDAVVGDTQVNVPANPVDGLSIGSGNETVSIGLPFAAEASHANAEQPGIVSYDNNNDSTTVPIVQKDGSVQINTVIESAQAPTGYSYPMSLPTGGYLVKHGESVSIVNSDGSPIALIEAPWALDADGKPVATHYLVNGNTLTQVVDHRSTPDVVYPVVADPKVVYLWWGYTAKFSKSETKQLATTASDSGALAFACMVLGPLAGVGCAAVIAIGTHYVAVFARNAVSHNKCVQFNIPYVGPGLLYEVTC